MADDHPVDVGGEFTCSDPGFAVFDLGVDGLRIACEIAA
jgi:hypothetical protein